jgi:hypothetical protein
MSKEPKHHYIPVFYLKQWMGGDDRVCEFSKPHDRVKPRRTHPDGTGYVRGLNTIAGLPPHEARGSKTSFSKSRMMPLHGLSEYYWPRRLGK